MIRAFIFDMDGLLVETESVHIRAFEKFMSDKGLPLPQGYALTLVGFSIRHNIERMQRELALQGDVESLAMERNRLYLEMLRGEPLAPLPGVAEAFEFARRQNLKTAVCSTSVREQLDTVLPRILAALGKSEPSEEFFAATVSGSDVAAPKPAPDLYLECARRLGLSPSECLAFEDSMAGARSATAAGMALVAVPNDFCPRDVAWPTPYVFATLRDFFGSGLLRPTAGGARLESSAREEAT